LKIFDFLKLNNPIEIIGTPIQYRLLPEESVVFQNVLRNGHNTFHPALLAQGLKQISTTAAFIFIDASYDPVAFSELEIQLTIELIQQQFINSKVVFLSGKSSHYYSEYNNVLWYPTFLLWDYPTPPRLRQKRIGCLNRRNSTHRVWLMYNLISQGLVDYDRDIFSVSFVSLFGPPTPTDVDGWIGQNTNYNSIIQQYPHTMATISDDFSNGTFIDMTTNHPAWATAITIVTETNYGDLGIISEKTVKAIASECCWVAYTGSDCIQVLTDLGFESNLIGQHVFDKNVAPIMDLCKTFDNESVAMDYYNSRIPEIQHNKQHLAHGWIDKYLPKLNSTLNSL
jgi:hypothetical protein